MTDDVIDDDNNDDDDDNSVGTRGTLASEDARTLDDASGGIGSTSAAAALWGDGVIGDGVIDDDEESTPLFGLLLSMRTRTTGLIDILVMSDIL